MATWRVVSQKYTERYLQNGQFVDVVIIGVTADDGSYADIVIPQAQYTPDNVKAQIDNWYQQHLAVRDLTGT